MFETALLVGGAFGVRHAFEADHLAAVATLVDRDDRPASTGAAWGLGHSIPILALGGLFLALDVRIPSAVAAGFELLAACILVVLGVRAVVGRESFGAALLRRVRSGDGGRTDGEHRHRHVTVAGRQIGFAHSHADEESFGVGVVHGLAGSGAVVVALVAASSSTLDGAGFLAGFSAATVAAMAAASWGWGRAVGRTDALRVVAGVVSVAVGLLLMAEVTGLAGLV